MKKNSFYGLSHGPFAESLKRAQGFGNNLVYSSMISDAITKMGRARIELNDALERDDERLIELKKLEIEAWKSSLNLTCLLLDDNDQDSLA